MISCVVISFFVLLVSSTLCFGCDKTTCGSLVSKCQLIKACSCTVPQVRSGTTNSRVARSIDSQPPLPAAVAAINNCTCCAECYRCVRNLYFECCDCVGMCPSQEPDASDYQVSTIGDLSDPMSEVFDLLTSGEDTLARFTVHSYPAHIVNDVHAKSTLPPPAICRVAFMAKCLSLKKCKDKCRAMGASRFRWFHEETCCQCVGHTCLDYGLGKASCVNCNTNVGSETSTLQLRGP